MNPQQTVLLVEDDHVDVLIIRRVFRDLSLPYPLAVTSDGEAALEYLLSPGRTLPGLIFLDLNMPRMNGLEFLAAIKQHPDLKSIPVVILTTSDHEEDRRQAMELSADAYLIKTLDYVQFLAAIRRLFHQA